MLTLGEALKKKSFLKKKKKKKVLQKMANIQLVQ